MSCADRFFSARFAGNATYSCYVEYLFTRFIHLALSFPSINRSCSSEIRPPARGGINSVSSWLYNLRRNPVRDIGVPIADAYPLAINYSGRVARHLNDERGRSRPVRGKRNRFKIVSSQKARAGRRKTRAEGKKSSVERDRNVPVDGEIPRVCYSLFGAGVSRLLRIKRKRG